MKVFKDWKRTLIVLLFVLFPIQIHLAQSSSIFHKSELIENDEWIQWDSSCMLDNHSNWIEFPDLAPAPSLNCERTNISLQSGETYSKTYGFIADKQIYIYLKVLNGDLDLLVYNENNSLFQNSSNYPEYDEYITFIPEVNGNYTIQITSDSMDEILETDGILYVRQNMVFAGTKINYSMDSDSESLSSIFFRVDQDFSRIEVKVQNAPSLELGNISIFHDQSYYDRDDFYSFIFYEITYEITYPYELNTIENLKYQGRQTLQWVFQQVSYSLPLKEVSAVNQSTFINISANLPYKPELALVEEENGFPAGSNVQITSKSGIGEVEILVFPVLNENITIDGDNPIVDDDTDDNFNDDSDVNPNDILNLDSIPSFSLNHFSFLLIFSVGIIVLLTKLKTK
ncbi:MAG: hypothetical protein ACTSRK_02715 [Promethearchaeota archaeon]